MKNRASLLLVVLFEAFFLAGGFAFTPAIAHGPVGLSGGFGAGIREVVEDQGRLVIRTDSAQYRLQGEVIVEIGAGKSVTAGAGEAAKPSLCPPPVEPFACGYVMPPPLPEPMLETMVGPLLVPTIEPWGDSITP